MLLSLHSPLSASDLGYLLHKNPARLHSFDLSFGRAHVFYPRNEKGGEAVLMLDVDSVDLVRGRKRSPGEAASLRQYVNDRPYATTSFISVALSKVFGTAMSGKSKERQELADQAHDWTAKITAAGCRGGSSIIERIFAPLGYEVAVEAHPLDPNFPEWGESAHFTVTLRGRRTLRELLAHLYVLLPTLDADKHYWVGQDEVDKLLRKGEGWLADHPDKALIARRYLARSRSLVREALERLSDDAETEETDKTAQEEAVERPLRLWERRLAAVLDVLREKNARSIADLGCGEGKLVRELIQDRSFERILGMDVSWRSLERAERRMRPDRMPEARLEQVQLVQGSLLYRDKRLEGFDAAVLAEVVEHLDPPRLEALERTLFRYAQPKTVVMTTPNAEYNVRFEGMAEGAMRHPDHRFEWTRSEFQSWASRVASASGYAVRFLPVGDEDPEVGAPTQMGVFER